MRTLLDEILSQETPGNKHAGGCGCAACAQKSATQFTLYPHWKARRQQRLGLGSGHSAQCNCTQCQAKKEGEFEYGDTDYHTYWRRQRQLQHDWPLDVEMEFEIDPTDYSTYQAFADAVAARAEREWSYWWDRGQLREDDEEAIPLLTDYWMQAKPGRSRSYAEILARNTSKPWSAAFISFVMQRAGAGRHFHYADGHWNYIHQARWATYNTDDNELYWLHLIENHKPQKSDLICYSREESGLNFNNALENKFRFAHCDIVVRVGNDTIDVVGGNKSVNGGNDQHGVTVGKRTLRLNKNGLIDKEYAPTNLFGIMSIWW